MNVAGIRSLSCASGTTTAYHCNLRTAFHVHRSQLQRHKHDSTLVAESVNARHDGTVADPETVPELATKDRPKRCADAISAGLEAFRAGQYNEAIDLFTLALELPGNGFMRLAGSPREYACPSEAEEQAALYNMACCYSKLDEPEPGITVLRGLLESGFDQFDTLRTDPDLEALRAAQEFRPLVDEFDKSSQGMFGRKNPRRAAAQKNWLDRW